MGDGMKRAFAATRATRNKAKGKTVTDTPLPVMKDRHVDTIHWLADHSSDARCWISSPEQAGLREVESVIAALASGEVVMVPRSEILDANEAIGDFYAEMESDNKGYFNAYTSMVHRLTYRWLTQTPEGKP